MAKKQTRRSISVSRNTYERLKVYCETNGISMSQFVERRVGDFLGATTGLSALVRSRPAPLQSAPVREPVDEKVKAAADSIFTF